MKSSVSKLQTIWKPQHRLSSVVVVFATSCSVGGVAIYYADNDTSQGRMDVNGVDLNAETELQLRQRKQIIVLGTGWGGISFLKSLNSKDFDVKVVSPRNYFVFTPLLPSVTSGTVDPHSITEPVRRIIQRKQKFVTYYEAECMEIDVKNKAVLCRDTTDVQVKGKEDFSLDYDYLVVAVGAQTNTFGTPGVKDHCLFLKKTKKALLQYFCSVFFHMRSGVTQANPDSFQIHNKKKPISEQLNALEMESCKDIEDAEKIHQDIVDCFETASLPHLSDEERRKMLHFVVVGGGPTGVEFAAELHDLVHDDLQKLYPDMHKFLQITFFDLKHD